MDILPKEDTPEEVTKLGGLLALFHGGGLVLALCWIFGILAILVGLGFLAAFGLLLKEGPAQGAGWGPGKLIFLGIFSLSAGAGLIRKAHSARGLRVFVCTDGIAVEVPGKPTTVMRWEDIDTVKRVVDANNQKLTISSAAQLVVKDRLGRELVFNETVSGLGELRQLVEEHTLKVMLPPAIEAFQSGAVIGFGDVSVGPDGIQCGRYTLPWDDFERAESAKGQLVLYSRNRRRRFARVALAKVPNYHVLLSLAERIGTPGPD